MGSQVNFYLSNKDHHNLVREMSEIDGICYVLPPLTSAVLAPLDLNSLQPWRPGEHEPVLFLRDHQLLLKLESGGPKQLFFVEESESPIVEFSRAIQRETEIQRGRLYYTSRFIDEDGYIHEKPPAFISFAKKIFKIAKNFCTERHEGLYVGPDAAVLHSKGYKLPLN